MPLAEEVELAGVHIWILTTRHNRYLIGGARDS